MWLCGLGALKGNVGSLYMMLTSVKVVMGVRECWVLIIDGGPNRTSEYVVRGFWAPRWQLDSTKAVMT